MLPLPNLDDKTYRQLFDESVKLIHKYSPAWTDENLHDPGITFIEMLAWLVEMQQYYLNVITDKSYAKFLKLLGMKPQGFAPAKVNVCFKGATVPVTINKGTPLYAGDITFETEEECNLLPMEIEKILVRENMQTFDQTSSNKSDGMSFYGFGEKVKYGNKLYIGFRSSLPVGKELSFAIDLYDNYPVKRIPIEGEYARNFRTPRIRYQYYGTGSENADGKAEWTDIKILSDKTYSFTESGKIAAIIPNNMVPIKIFPANDKDRYWLCFSIELEEYELSPRICSIQLNTVSAIQKETISELSIFSGSGKAGRNIVLNSYLPYCGNNLVQVLSEDGSWHDWVEVPELNNYINGGRCFTVTRNKEDKSVKISFSDGKNSSLISKGEGNIRIISYLPMLEADLLLGSGNGQINQMIKLPYFPVMSENLIIQVGRYDKEANVMCWEDWTCRESLDASGKEDRHYTLNETTGEITFGDNINGIIPYHSEVSNIRAVNYCITFGERGNIGKNLIMDLPGINDEYMGIRAVNGHPASGGRDLESLRNVMVRFRREQKKAFRAVTARDFEEIALGTPGIRIARVKAIPLFSPDIREYNNQKASSQVTLVVVPYSDNKTPVPGKEFLKSVKIHLDEYRQITTQVHVIGPQYVKISVHAFVVGIAGSKVNKMAILESLMDYIKPLDGVDGSKGWPFGKAVYKNDIYGIIKAVEGVGYVKELWISSEGNGSSMNAAGDILLPPHGIVYSGEHEIEISENED